MPGRALLGNLKETSAGLSTHRRSYNMPPIPWLITSLRHALVLSSLRDNLLPRAVTRAIVRDPDLLNSVLDGKASRVGVTSGTTGGSKGSYQRERAAERLGKQTPALDARPSREHASDSPHAAKRQR